VYIVIIWISLRDYDRMSQLICPLCGKFVSVRYYDPSDFEDDILLVQVRGLGRGKGVEIVETYSLLDGDETYLLDLISDRVAVLYNLLYENNGDDEDEEEDEEEDVLVDEDEEKEDDGEGGRARRLSYESGIRLRMAGITKPAKI